MINPYNYHPGQTPIEQKVGLYRLGILHPEHPVDSYQIIKDNGRCVAVFGYLEHEGCWAVRPTIWAETEYREGGPEHWISMAEYCIDKQFGNSHERPKEQADALACVTSN